MFAKGEAVPDGRPHMRSIARENRLELLMERYADGDAEAFDELYRLLSPRVEARLRPVLGSRDHIDDVLQTTFMKVHRARDRYRRGTPVTPWVQRIARNAAVDEIRARSRRQELATDKIDDAVDEGHESPDDTWSREEDIDRVRKAIDQLPEISRDIIRRHKLDGVPLTDIARGLDLNINTVRVRAHRGYKKLREIIFEAPER